MDRLLRFIDQQPTLAYVSRQTHIGPRYLAIALSILSIILIQNASLGPLLSNTILLLLPTRDALLELRSKNPRLAELKRHLIILLLFLFSVILDCFGISRLIPLFSIVKLGFILWARSSEQNAAWAYEHLIALIPVEDARLSDTISRAGAKAREAVNEKVEIKQDKKNE